MVSLEYICKVLVLQIQHLTDKVFFLLGVEGKREGSYYKTKCLEVLRMESIGKQ